MDGRLAKAVLNEVADLKQQMTAENCGRLADEVATTLEQARAAVAAHSTPETRAILEKAHAHALDLAAAPFTAMAVFNPAKFEQLTTALERLDPLPSWEDPLLDPPTG